MAPKGKSQVTRSTSTVGGGLSSAQALDLTTSPDPSSPLPIQVASPNETTGDALIEDGSASHVVILNQSNQSAEETPLPPAQSTTLVDISIMETPVVSSATPILETSAPAEQEEDVGTPPPPAIMWNKMPNSDPSCLGTGYFPFDRGTEDPPQYVVHDIQLRGRVTASNILARPQYTHTLDVTLTDDDVARIQTFVLSSGKVPSTATGFKWTINPSAMTLRFANKKDIGMDFEPVWDARGRDPDTWGDIDGRVYISAREITRNSIVFVEAIPEIWQRPDGERLVSMGCTMHLTAVGLVDDGPAPPVKREDMTNYSFKSPKKRCVRPFTKREVT